MSGRDEVLVENVAKALEGMASRVRSGACSHHNLETIVHDRSLVDRFVKATIPAEAVSGVRYGA